MYLIIQTINKLGRDTEFVTNYDQRFFDILNYTTVLIVVTPSRTAPLNFVQL